MRQYFSPGSTVLFQGDSVTDCSRTSKGGGLGIGYPAKVAAIHHTLFPDSGVTFINRAVSGNRVRDLLARYEEDFVKVKPDFLSILIGINDTWRAFDHNDPCPLLRFAKEYRELLTKIKTDLPTTQLMLITPFVLHTDPAKALWHEDLDPKIACVKELAEDFDCILLDHAAVLQRVVEDSDYSEQALSADGVHPTDLGQSLLAVAYLEKLKIFE